MARTIISLKRGRDRAAFMREAKQAGIKLEQIKGLPRHFLVNGVAPTTFPLRAHAAIEAIENGDAEAREADAQPITIDASLTQGNWGVARIIRRRAPWNIDRLLHPIETYFRSVRDGAGVDIYTIDGGLRATHDEFGGRAEVVWSFNSDLNDNDTGHGSMVASLAGGLTVGIARAAEIFAFKWNQTGAGSASDVVAAVGEVISHYQGRSGLGRPAIVNCSFGINSSTVNSAISDLIDEGMVVVASAMNDGADLDDITVYPAESTDTICVGGIGPADIPGYFSRDDGSMSITNYGSRVDIMAPGQYLRTASPSGDSIYLRSSGSTSGAAALTSGVVACMLQGHSRLSGRTQVQAVKTKLLANATTGRFRDAFDLEPLPDRVLYLDPNQAAPEPISGL